MKLDEKTLESWEKEAKDFKYLPDKTAFPPFAHFQNNKVLVLIEALRKERAARKKLEWALEVYRDSPEGKPHYATLALEEAKKILEGDKK